MRVEGSRASKAPDPSKGEGGGGEPSVGEERCGEECRIRVDSEVGYPPSIRLGFDSDSTWILGGIPPRTPRIPQDPPGSPQDPQVAF